MGSVTRVLNDASLQGALQDQKLQALLYQELRVIARAKLNHHAQNNGLNTTALVHEAYLKLNDHADDKQWRNRRHFYATAALAMRHILVDAARQRLTAKRGQDQGMVTLDEGDLKLGEDCEQLVALHDSLQQLKAVDTHLVDVVNLRYFVGLSVAETAEIMHVSKRTVDRQWSKAKALLLAWIQ